MASPEASGMRAMRRGLLAVLALALPAVAACTQGSQPQPQVSSRPGQAGGGPVVVGRPASVQWHACGGSSAKMRCASLKVPLDYAKPAGRKITLALSEVPATVAPSQRRGILLVNPGGPGGSGLSLASFVAQGLSPAVAAKYDIVGFDTRGVGASVPSLHCDPAFFARERPNYIPANAAAEQVLIGRARAYAADCERKYRRLLPYMTTANIARDMDQIRGALGQPQLSYLGYSYGTYIGQVYATLFPNRVYRMALDSIVDPTGVWYADNIAQDYAFQGRMNAFFGWAARYDNVYHTGATASGVSRSWYQARGRLAAHPAAQASGPSIGPDEFDDTFVVGGYDDGYWPSLAGALASYLHTGETSQLVTVFNQAGKQKACAADANRRAGTTRHPHVAGHPGRGNALCRRSERAPAAADGQDGRRPWRRKPRAVAGVPPQFMCQRILEQIPGDRRAAIQARPCRRRLRAGTRPGARRLTHAASHAVTLKGCCAPGLRIHPRSGC